MTIIELIQYRIKNNNGVYLDMLSVSYWDIIYVRANIDDCRHLLSFFGGDPEWYL